MHKPAFNPVMSQPTAMPPPVIQHLGISETPMGYQFPAQTENVLYQNSAPPFMHGSVEVVYPEVNLMGTNQPYEEKENFGTASLIAAGITGING